MILFYAGVALAVISVVTAMAMCYTALTDLEKGDLA